jgi:pyruvate/2-oxoglutarate dehydrogenase complex dihydrolipoamide acyltransferase (E2) component
MLRIELPPLSADMTTGRIDRWHKDVGDDVAYGDELLDLIVEEFTRVARSYSARKSVLQRRKGARIDKRRAARVRFRVIALDEGVLRRIDAVRGASVEQGDPLALLDPFGSNPNRQSGPALARVVATRIDFADSDVDA